jgi:hypothetical protein
MILLVESQSTPAIVVIVFLMNYAIALATFALSRLLANRRIALDLKSTTPVILTPLSVVASLLIVFLAAHVWANLDHAGGYVTQEASALHEAVLLSQNVPAGTRNAVRGSIRDYLAFVDTEDWPSMAKSRADLQRQPPGLSDAIKATLSFNPADRGQQLAQQQILVALERALEARRQRILLSQAGVEPIQWIVIFVLEVLLLLTLASVHIDRAITAGFGVFVLSTAFASCLILLLINDRPFSEGGYTVQPIALHQIGLE